MLLNRPSFLEKDASLIYSNFSFSTRWIPTSFIISSSYKSTKCCQSMFLLLHTRKRLISTYKVTHQKWLSEKKSDMLAYKLKLILLAQLIATLNDYACSLPPLAKVIWSAFPEGFCRPCKSTTGEMASMEGSSLAVGTSYGSYFQYTSV